MSRKTRAELELRVQELEAQLPSALWAADGTLQDAGDALMGSGVVVRLAALGGRELTRPFVILDGLSDATIAAIREDIRRSWRLSTMAAPSSSGCGGPSTAT